jgi:hypothetical protein
MGYSGREVLAGGVTGFALLSGAGVLLGIPLAMRLSDMFARTFETLMTLPPTTLDLGVTGVRSVLVMVVAILTVTVALRSNVRRSVAEGLKRVFDTM